MITALLRAVTLNAPLLALSALLLVSSRWCGNYQWSVSGLGLLILNAVMFKIGWDARSAHQRSRCPQRQHRLLVDRRQFEEASKR